MGAPSLKAIYSEAFKVCLSPKKKMRDYFILNIIFNNLLFLVLPVLVKGNLCVYYDGPFRHSFVSVGMPL